MEQIKLEENKNVFQIGLEEGPHIAVVTGWTDEQQPIVNNTYDLGTESLRWANVYNSTSEVDFRVRCKDDSDLFVCDCNCKRVYIKGIDFDSILGRLEKLEKQGFWKTILGIFKRRPNVE